MAQSDASCFLDASMNEVPSNLSAKYSRTCEMTDGVFEVSVAHLDGSLKYTGSYLDPECTIEHGTFTYYYQNGYKESQGDFVKGIKSGTWERWDWTGEKKADRFYPGISVEDIRKRHETEPAKFPGGEEAMWSFIKNNLEYPEQAKKQSLEGDVEIAFNIDSLGYINNVQIINSVNYFLDKEALRLIWMMPQWEPAKRRGEAVESKFIMPLTFRLAPLRKAN
jgi:TonB family protein